jgi:hypothetical protein
MTIVTRILDNFLLAGHPSEVRNNVNGKTIDSPRGERQTDSIHMASLWLLNNPTSRETAHKILSPAHSSQVRE